MSSSQSGGNGRHAQAGKDASVAKKIYRDPFVGLIPELPTLNVRDGDCNPLKVQTFMRDFKTDTMTKMAPELDNIFLEAGAAYPELVAPDDPEDARRGMDVERWKLEMKLYVERVERLNRDKIQLTGTILGQLGPNSRDRVEKLEAGRAAIDAKDPLELVKAIVATHLVSSRLDNNDNFYQSQMNYNGIRMGETESIENYNRRFRGMLASLTQAARVAGQEGSVPDDRMQAIHFIYTLSAAYSDFRLAYDRKQLKEDHIPDTAVKAYAEAIDFGTNRRANSQMDRPTRAGVFAATKRGGGRGGRGRGDDRRGRGEGFRGICFGCNKPGHRKQDCPEQKERDDIARAVKEVGSAKSNK
jgi:hypothetical protein